MKIKSLALACAIALPVFASADWQPYVGIGGGLQYFTQSSSITNTYNVYTLQQLNYPFTFNNDHRGGVLNVFAGIGNTFNNNVYTALELNVFYNPATYTSSTYYYNYNLPAPSTLYGNSYMTSSMPWHFDLSGILGYRLTQNWMPYVRLGVDVGDFQENYALYNTGTANTGTPLTAQTHVSSTLFGGTIGLGSRYDINEHWFVSAEGDYTRFLNNNPSTPSWYLDSQDQPYLVSNTPYQYHFQTALWTLLARVGYQF